MVYLGNQTSLFGPLRFPTQRHSRQHYLGLPAFMFSNFAGIPAKSAHGTRTNFDYFLGDLTDADAPT